MGSEENGWAEMLSKESPFEVGYLPTAPDYLKRSDPVRVRNRYLGVDGGRECSVA